MGIPSEVSKTFTAISAVGPPRNLRLVEIVNNAMLVEWQPPEVDGGSKIATYVVECRELPKGFWVRCNYETVAKCEFLIENLVRGFSYELRVTARNAGGVLGFPSQVLGPVWLRTMREPPTCHIEEINPKKSFEVGRGKTLRLRAVIAGLPRPKVEWLSEPGQDLSRDKRTKISS